MLCGAEQLIGSLPEVKWAQQVKHLSAELQEESLQIIVQHLPQVICTQAFQDLRKVRKHYGSTSAHYLKCLKVIRQIYIIHQILLCLSRSFSCWLLMLAWKIIRKKGVEQLVFLWCWHDNVLMIVIRAHECTCASLDGEVKYRLEFLWTVNYCLHCSVNLILSKQHNLRKRSNQ